MSAKALRTTLLVLCVIGIGIAGYLTYVHYAEIKPLCTAGNSCIKVQSSVYSKLAGVPVALIGLLGYLAILASLLLPENENTRMATMILVVIGFGFSMYLTGREIFTIKAICEWCATSAGILTIMAILSVWRFLRGGGPAAVAPAAAAPPDTPASGIVAGGSGPVS